MKKLIVILAVLFALFALAGCVDYTEEFNAALDTFDEKVEAHEDAVDEFESQLDEIDPEAELEALCDDMVKADEEMIADCESLLEEIQGYEKGIKDEDEFADAIAEINDQIAEVKEHKDAVPDVVDFYNLSMDFIDLAAEWEQVITTEAEALTTAQDVDTLNDAIYNIINIDNDYMDQMIELKSELGELSYPSMQDDLEEALEGVDMAIDAIVELNEQLETLIQ
ncbi:MAG: hypothetical protein JXN65_02035 [Clostridia bacterium]|nr:hypothetical protein [Clostridia bacterium]